MSYATIDNVKSMFRLFASGANAAVTDPEIQLFLDNTTASINAKIGTLYTLPATEGDNPEAFAILKQLQMYKVACIIDNILNNYPQADKKPMWCKKAQHMMDALVPPVDPKTCKQCPPTIILPDLPYKGVPEQRNRITISRTDGVTFRKGQDNW